MREIAAVHGKGGSVTADSNTVALITSWSYDETADLAEVSAMGDTDKTYLFGLKDGSGTMDGFLDGATSTGQDLIRVGATVSVVLKATGTVPSFTIATAKIESVSFGAGVADAVTFSASFKGVATEA